MESIGRYRLLKRLAAGGMGEVWLAAQTGAQGFQKFVAVKRVSSTAASDPELISLFLDEARLVATLSHRSIVQILDLGQDDQGFFVAMEFVQGPSVRALLDRLASKGQKLPPALALDIAAQVGDALACAYYSRAADGTPLRIIHRDVSPRNILVSASGDVKLIDFGIAQSMRQGGFATQVSGKLSYMSPEHLRSEPLNARSDLFSLGIILCEMLTGENPFARTDPKEMAAAIQREEPKLPSEKDPALAPCDAVVKRLLAKLPSERYADGIELAEALAELRTRFPKPPRRLGALVSDLFGLEIAELLQEASKSTPKADAPETPATPKPAATPAESAKPVVVGQVDDEEIFERVTLPYVTVPRTRRKKTASEMPAATPEASGEKPAEPTQAPPATAPFPPPPTAEPKPEANPKPEAPKDFVPSPLRSVAASRPLAPGEMGAMSGETTLPGVKPARSRRAQLRTMGLIALAGAAVLVGIAMGLWIVRDSAQPTPPVAAVAAPPAAEPVAPPAAEPPAPAAVESAEPKVDAVPAQPAAEPSEALTPLKAATGEPKPAPAVGTEAAKGAAPEEAKPAAVAATATDAKGTSLQLVIVGPGGESTTAPLAGSGLIELGAAKGITAYVAYHVSTKGLRTTLECQPWAIAAVNGLSVGKTPVTLELTPEPTRVELRKPGIEPLTYQLSLKGTP